MEQAEASAAGSRAAEATGPAVSEVQSRDSSNLAEPAAAVAALPAAGAAAGAAAAFAQLRGGAAAALPATPAGAVHADSCTPEPASTGQQSSILSAAGDPTVPFSAPPSTSRRFATRDGAGAATSRRWAWRRDGAGGGAGAGASTFQRARLASASRPESPSSDAAGAVPVGAEGPAAVAGSLGRSGSPAELSSRRTTSEEAAVGPHGGAAMPASAVAAAIGTAGGHPATSSAPGTAGLAQFQPVPPTFGSGASGNGADAAAAAGAAQRQQRAVPGLGSGLLPAISLMGGDSVVLPSPVDHARGAASTPHAPNSLVVDALLQELRNMAALEVRPPGFGGAGGWPGRGRGRSGHGAVSSPAAQCPCHFLQCPCPGLRPLPHVCCLPIKLGPDSPPWPGLLLAHLPACAACSPLCTWPAGGRPSLAAAASCMPLRAGWPEPSSAWGRMRGWPLASRPSVP